MRISDWSSDVCSSDLVARVVERLAAVVGRTPAGSRLNWAVEIPAGTLARIDADDLAEALGNLIENAARHAHSSVAVGAREEAGLAVVTVSDDGGGSKPERRDETLRTGRRLDNISRGAGLGPPLRADAAVDL